MPMANARTTLPVKRLAEYAAALAVLAASVGGSVTWMESRVTAVVRDELARSRAIERIAALADKLDTLPLDDESRAETLTALRLWCQQLEPADRPARCG